MNAAANSTAGKSVVTNNAAIDDYSAFRARIRCDKETQRRDKCHSYVVLSSVKAKGYAEPVATFRPIRLRTYNPSANIDSIFVFTMKSLNCCEVLIGRLGELEDTVDFFLRTASGHEKAPVTHRHDH
jgi:hypothetical protein